MSGVWLMVNDMPSGNHWMMPFPPISFQLIGSTVLVIRLISSASIVFGACPGRLFIEFSRYEPCCPWLPAPLLDEEPIGWPFCRPPGLVQGVGALNWFLFSKCKPKI